MSVEKNMQIPFSPPDISDLEIKEVIDTLKSGWITTGPKTKLFEKKIAEYVGVDKAVCLNSATAALELTLRILGIGPGDEVITTAYTYTATASVITHVGAKIRLIDTAPNSFEMDYEQLENAINEKTKVIIPVDLAGIVCDYDKIFEAVQRKSKLFSAQNELQSVFDRVIVITDAAHALGAKKGGRNCGQIADFTCFSFHAVKNLTTAEGGAVVWRNNEKLDDEFLYKQYMLYSLHGQSKDALEKSQVGAWEYDIIIPAYKCNMTDIMASIGLVQLERYADMLERRREIISMYINGLKNVSLYDHYTEASTSSGHLFFVRVDGIDEQKRNELIVLLAERGISTNVHYKPLPMLTAYKNLGFDIVDFPNAYDMYRNEITLPLHTNLTNEEVHYIITQFNQVVAEYLELEYV